MCGNQKNGEERMTREEFRQMIEKGPVLLDGGTGSCLRTMGMPVGVCTEKWIYEHPEVMKELQNSYLDAGSQIIYAPTFGANRVSLGNLGLEDLVEELNRTLVERTRENAKGRALVAGDLSTTGKAMEPYGPMTYDGLMEVYKEQIGLLAEAGADLLIAETLMSLDEALVICDAAREVCELPLMISFSCESDGSLYFGGNVFEAAAALEAMDVDAVGVNCSVGPDQLEAVVQNLRETVSIPILTKPNAGVPSITETGDAVYSMGEADFARNVLHLLECGASIVGGCCGTTPDYIQKIKKNL
jgi:5-methyltetrahydrofolate--homocysteine methyltransferase